ncbi:hypothetical protein [Caminicella sporogenes]|uniref:hypothetical protein n=1 Tax=Caminicella sporogenes TaxID=166485 RepID=UPI002541B3AB|nr:hypothetical protein [Caminicella sporogenes]WIF95140.1 hypothetical protein QNI18_00430 [Caminicella sporogenes]
MKTPLEIIKMKNGLYMFETPLREVAEEIVKRVNEYEELKEIIEIQKVEIEEHRKQNPVFTDGGNLEECMVLRSRIEDLELLNRELVELLKEQINEQETDIEVWFEHYNYWVKKVKKALAKAEVLE